MCVPECPWVAPRRQFGSTAAITVSPSTNSPDSIADAVHPQRLADLLRVGDSGSGRFAGVPVPPM
jgi:hypothetical protein